MKTKGDLDILFAALGDRLIIGVVGRARPRAHCCVCPHEDYLTVSVSEHRHECFSCGETFVDAKRVKKYFGRAPR